MIHIGDFSASTSLNIPTNTGRIQVIKKDAETSANIEGVTFQLLKDNKEVARATTNSQGIATFSSLYQGKYQIKELSTNDNYIMSDATFDVEVEYDKIATKTITNEHKKGNLKINKTDEDTSEPISGVTFQLLDLSNNIIASGTTDTNGELLFNDLRTGKYKLKETRNKP